MGWLGYEFSSVTRDYPRFKWLKDGSLIYEHRGEAATKNIGFIFFSVVEVIYASSIRSCMYIESVLSLDMVIIAVLQVASSKDTSGYTRKKT